MNTFRIKSGSTLPELMQLRVFVPEFESRCLLFPLSRATSQKPEDERRCWEIPMSSNTLLTLAAAHIFKENLNEGSMNMKWLEWRTTFCIHMSLFSYYYLLLNLVFLEHIHYWCDYCMCWSVFSLIFKSSKNWSRGAEFFSSVGFCVVPSSTLCLVFVVVVCFCMWIGNEGIRLSTALNRGERMCIKPSEMHKIERSIIINSYTLGSTKLCFRLSMKGSLF